MPHVDVRHGTAVKLGQTRRRIERLREVGVSCAKEKAAIVRIATFDVEAVVTSNQPHKRSQRTTARPDAQAVPITAGRGGTPGWNSDEGRLLAMMFAVDGLMPKHRLTADAIGAAAAAMRLATSELLPVLLEKFARSTSITPGTAAYNRAEFRDAVYALYQLARIFNKGSRAPAELALYCFFSSAGVGPHPDRDLWRKLGAGMSLAERRECTRRYQSWRSHLRNRVALVRQAIDPRSVLSRQQRASILDADPLIAMELREDIPRQIRLSRGKAR